MNKKELISRIAADTHLKKITVEAVLNSALDNITMTVSKGDKVIIAGFGTFESVFRDSRKGRNIHTGESIRIKAKFIPTFKPSKRFKDIVISKYRDS